MQGKQWKLGSAAIGVSAVVAMGAFGAIFGDVGSAEPADVVAPVAQQAKEPTTIEPAVTTTTPPPAPETSVASPTVTATTPSGFAPAPGP